jgi:5,10-methylenetetrahydrofolate reductase
MKQILQDSYLLKTHPPKYKINKDSSTLWGEAWTRAEAMGAAETPARASVKPAPRSASESTPGIETAAISKSTYEVIVHVQIIKTNKVEIMPHYLSF